MTQHTKVKNSPLPPGGLVADALADVAATVLVAFGIALFIGVATHAAWVEGLLSLMDHVCACGMAAIAEAT